MYNALYKTALGMVYSAGYTLDYIQKRELDKVTLFASPQSVYTLQRQGKLADAAMAAIHDAGLDISKPAWVDRGPNPVPMAGDLVRLGKDWSIMQAGEMVGLQGDHTQPATGYTYANKRGGWHIGPRFISMGNGGPASHAEMQADALEWRGEKSTLNVWSWIDLPCAQGGFDWVRPALVWEQI